MLSSEIPIVPTILKADLLPGAGSKENLEILFGELRLEHLSIGEEAHFFVSPHTFLCLNILFE